MRTVLVIIILLLPAAAIVNTVVHGLRLVRFRHSLSRFENGPDMALFRPVVRRQMVAAVVQVGLLTAPLLIFLGGVATGALSPRDLPLVVVPAVLIVALGYVFKKVENEVRSIPAATDELARERDEVVATWTRKALPDW